MLSLIYGSRWTAKFLLLQQLNTHLFQTHVSQCQTFHTVAHTENMWLWCFRKGQRAPGRHDHKMFDTKTAFIPVAWKVLISLWVQLFLNSFTSWSFWCSSEASMSSCQICHHPQAVMKISVTKSLNTFGAKEMRVWIITVFLGGTQHLFVLQICRYRHTR